MIVLLGWGGGWIGEPMTSQFPLQKMVTIWLSWGLQSWPKPSPHIKWDGYQNLHDQIKDPNNPDECQIWDSSNLQGCNECGGIRAIRGIRLITGREKVGPHRPGYPSKLSCDIGTASATTILKVAYMSATCQVEIKANPFFILVRSLWFMLMNITQYINLCQGSPSLLYQKWNICKKNPHGVL